ncbi:MAG: hypothetical protein J6S19_07365 [Lentisphaeria bacterium]|nr:hypothetical protein [Lentisphaeria bacterium]
MSVYVGFSKVDLMDVMPEKRRCEMPLSGRGFYLAQAEKCSFFFTADLMDLDLLTVKTLENALAEVLPENTQIHILSTHNHGGDDSEKLNMELFCRLAAGCAGDAVAAARPAKVRTAVGGIDEKLAYMRRLFVPEVEGSFTCFYGIGSGGSGDAVSFAENAVKALENDTLLFAGRGTKAEKNGRYFLPADPQVAVLEFRSTDDLPLGNIVRFASHAVCCNLPDCYSADYPGYLRGIMEKQLGGVSVFWNGPCAEIAPAIPHKSAEYGALLAGKIAGKALSLLEDVPFEKLESFRDTFMKAVLPVRQEVLDGKIAAADEDLTGKTPAEKKKILERKQLEIRLPFLQKIHRNGENIFCKEITLHNALLEINNWNVLFFSGETFSSTAQEITATFPEKQWVTVTEHGRTAMYIPPEREYLRGGYEPACAVVAANGEAELKLQMTALLEKHFCKS